MAFPDVVGSFRVCGPVGNLTCRSKCHIISRFQALGHGPLEIAEPTKHLEPKPKDNSPESSRWKSPGFGGKKLGKPWILTDFQLFSDVCGRRLSYEAADLQVLHQPHARP